MGRMSVLRPWPAKKRGRPSTFPKARLRELWDAEPYLSGQAIAKALGICEATVYVWAKRLKLPNRSTPERLKAWRSQGGKRGAVTKRGVLKPKRWRCARCGGQRDAQHPHACRPAEPLSMGLQWERLA